jgi:predicted alpha/beta hydrolase family esterase
MKKQQILMVHGGMTFKTEKDYLKFLKTKRISTVSKPYWEADLEKKFKKKFDVIRPRMPLADNAKYRDWAILFGRYVKLLTKDSILIGSSLGGIFLAKYLSENKLPRKALSVFLVCAPFDDTCPGEDLVGGFELKKDLSLIEKNTKNLHILFSKDDDVVPVAHAEKYRKKLPNAHLVIYKSKNGHFDVPTFPEIITLIKADLRG